MQAGVSGHSLLSPGKQRWLRRPFPAEGNMQEPLGADNSSKKITDPMWKDGRGLADAQVPGAIIENFVSGGVGTKHSIWRSHRGAQCQHVLTLPNGRLQKAFFLGARGFVLHAGEAASSHRQLFLAVSMWLHRGLAWATPYPSFALVCTCSLKIILLRASRKGNQLSKRWFLSSALKQNL